MPHQSLIPDQGKLFYLPNKVDNSHKLLQRSMTIIPKQSIQNHHSYEQKTISSLEFVATNMPYRDRKQNNKPSWRSTTRCSPHDQKAENLSRTRQLDGTEASTDQAAGETKKLKGRGWGGWGGGGGPPSDLRL